MNVHKLSLHIIFSWYPIYLLSVYVQPFSPRLVRALYSTNLVLCLLFGIYHRHVFIFGPYVCFDHFERKRQLSLNLELCLYWNGKYEKFGSSRFHPYWVLWPSDVIWQQASRSTLAQVMACCLMAPSHYLNQCWLMIIEVLWPSPNSNFTENT